MIEKVEQCDRDAAAALIEEYWSGSDASMMKLAKSYRAGHSQGAFVRAFARHRRQSLEALDNPSEAVIEAGARAIAASKRGVEPDFPTIDVVWPSYVGQARAALPAMIKVALTIKPRLFAAVNELPALLDENERLRAEAEQAQRERNIAYAKVKAWESVVYVEGLPLRAVPVGEWGPGEGETTTVPEVTPKKLTELLDELRTARAALGDRSP